MDNIYGRAHDVFKVDKATAPGVPSILCIQNEGYSRNVLCVHSNLTTAIDMQYCSEFGNFVISFIYGMLSDINVSQVLIIYNA
jgi:hypothetical protein